MRGHKILITGPTGQVATPIAMSLAADNEVWGIARFTDGAARERLERAGIHCEQVNLAAGDFSRLPSDFDYVLNLAVAKSGRWDKDLAANAESVGLLMAHCADATAFLHCSSAAVYDPPGDEPRTEAAALGDNHKPLFPTYSISKIAGEVVARTMARTLGLPTVIARLNVPYGDNGGWPFYQMEMMLAGIPLPVPPGGPARYNPIHQDDIIAMLPRMLEAATVPATTVNWCGDQTVSLQEWCTYIGELIGRDPVFEVSDQALPTGPTDTTKMHEIAGGTSVDWRDGIRRMVSTFHPELVAPSAV
ncbi:NAD-dependent epimerase/dehydratase family protein [Mycolicibacterium neoaurum]|uniref:NAD dependent epimerase/dehydratase n=1 Tax=Mycolicibacterium neoaurum TaxID=1795 RepID=A0AAV2WIT4_MYCNE|nr:NAD(P)-dependent oxidoreductase [Mycolicibacterium neoaurum]QVI26390.1 NAD(P)-dependent oxidoreductase [Mycolicibacterium neoaurum]TLH63464.1 NAD(P)-dependent oxidoreductase [Mycolicibacterium neoaurum]CDQ43846.1 NAD dependent epimerase/dehydratase [Mycolicibacterium neoaurum]SDE33533.1 Nucleoside-diphosphate-sugar epimerase [Mycolicibacterium neoaurum]